MTDCECPGCGARLRNVEAGADGQVLCLNCGRRFGLGQTAAAPVRAQTDEARKPPQAAGYGYFSLFGRAVGIAVVVAAVLGGGALIGMQNIPLSVLTAVVCLACGGLCGFACEVLGKTPERLDALLIRVAERLDALPESVAPAPASSLPFILPFMLLGGVLIILANCLLGGYTLPSGESEAKEACLLGLGGVVSFLAGLAMGDAQRFLLRAVLLGGAIGGEAGSGRQGQPARAPLLMLGAAAVFLVAAPLLLMSSGFTGEVLCSMVAPGLCYTLYRVSRLAAEAVGIWEAATEGLGRGWALETPWPRHWGPHFAAWVAYFIGFGLVWISDMDVSAILLLGLCLVAIWLGKIALLVQRAERVAERLALHLSPPAEGAPRLDAWANLRSKWAFVALNLFCVVLFLLLFGTLRSEWGLYRWREFLLETLVLCYPMLWLATVAASLVRSVGYLARAAEGRRATGS